MSRAACCVAVLATVLLGVATPTRAQITELHGSWIIDGYRFEPGDRSPRGTVVYDRMANAFTGTYVGLKLPPERPELRAWLYDTRSKQAVISAGCRSRRTRWARRRAHSSSRSPRNSRRERSVATRCQTRGAERQQDLADAEAGVLPLRAAARREHPAGLLRPRAGLHVHVEPGSHLLRLTVRRALPGVRGGWQGPARAEVAR
jgi:hypothetical protein